MKYVMALDQGTTSSRAMVFDREGRVAASAQREFRQIYPRPGWVEHDPEEIWLTQLAVAREALREAGAGPGDVAAVGITNQRETAVMWDRRTGRPVGNAIVWQDRRTAGMCDRLKAEGREGMVREKTGLVIDPYFTGTKLNWMLDHGDGLRARAERGELACGTVDSWLIHKLTGGRVHATDVTNASRTMLFDIRKLDWDEELLAMLGVPRGMMPEVKASSGVVGETTAGVLGDRGVPIAGIAGDQQAALFGQMCVEPGMMKVTYGTGGFVLQQTGAEALESKSRMLTTVAWQREGEKAAYALEGSVFIAGAVVQWLRDGLGLIGSSGEIGKLAGTVEDNGGVYFVPAFVGLGAPHWDARARGTIVGLTRGTTKGDLARAAEEAIAFQVADVTEAMQADSGMAAEELRADGGAARDDLLLQLQSDILQMPIMRPEMTETTAFGAAALAGLAVGFWKDMGELRRLWRAERRFEPRMSEADARKLRSRWREAVERARGWGEAEP